MEISSMVSSPRNSGVSMTEEEEEESGWTAYFVDYEVRRQTEKDDEAGLETSYSNSITVMSSSASMVSDAGSGPDWILRNNNMMKNHSIPKRLNMIKAKPKEMHNHEELEDTASSPVNSPKINKYFKRIDINCGRRPEETFDTTYLGKAAKSINEVDKAGKELADKGFYLVLPYTELMKLNYYHTNLHRF